MMSFLRSTEQNGSILQFPSPITGQAQGAIEDAGSTNGQSVRILTVIESHLHDMTDDPAHVDKGSSKMSKLCRNRLDSVGG